MAEGRQDSKEKNGEGRRFLGAFSGVRKCELKLNRGQPIGSERLAKGEQQSVPRRLPRVNV